MIDLKNPEEIGIMKAGGRLLSEAARELKERVRPGITTKDLDNRATALLREKEMKEAFLNYGTPPFPAAICTSINDEVVHGIPSADRVLNEGDIISIDIGGVWNGFFVDMAFTVPVGKVSDRANRLIKITRQALESAISKMYTSCKLGDVSWTIQKTAESEGYNVVRDLVGHGVGRNLHEPPNVPNYGKKKSGIKLEPGLVLALEPMLNEGSGSVIYDDDGWTVRTADGGLSCHFEHTVAVTENGPEPLTEFEW